MLEHEVAAMLREKAMERKNKIKTQSEELDQIFNNEDTQKAAMIDENDLKFLATTRVKLT